tara:strand:+ start:9698 stop:10702 length:1005 start_codon:yes stop_codon:yes gene_type:complete
MPTNSNGNSKADALELLDIMGIRGDARTFMDCVKKLTTESYRKKEEKLYLYGSILYNMDIKTIQDLGNKINEPFIFNKCKARWNETILIVVKDAFINNTFHYQGTYLDGIGGDNRFLKWCANKEPTDTWNNSNEQLSAYFSRKYDCTISCIEVIMKNIQGDKDVIRKLEKNIESLKESNKLFQEEIFTLTDIIEENNITLNVCGLCNTKIADEELEDGKPLNKCGNMMCLTCMKKIKETKNTTPTPDNTEILCPDAKIPFSYFKTKCPYCREGNCLPEWNKYKSLVVKTMDSIIGWSLKGETKLTPSFVRSCNVMYKITNRHYLPMDINLLENR